jgi:hypothetical protein
MGGKAHRFLQTMSRGETNLQTLLIGMQPELNEGEYVFVSLKEDVVSACKKTRSLIRKLQE